MVLFIPVFLVLLKVTRPIFFEIYKEYEFVLIAYL